jgi:hypothetical protein
VSIVIPVRDAAGLPPMLRGLPAADEVIVVTAGPGSDAAVLAACPAALLVRQTRTGLGNALACGFAASTGDMVITLDGDGATDPGELPRYVEALRAGADVAFGSRYCEGGRDLTGGRFHRGLNLALAWLLNALYGVRRTDPGFGYAAFWRDALENLTLPSPAPAAPATWGDGPEIEALLAVRAAARGLTVTEVPSVAYPRMRRSSHADRTTVRHWLRALLTEFRHRTARPPRHAAPETAPDLSGRPGFPPPRHVSQPPPQPPDPERRFLPDRRVSLSDRRAATAKGPASEQSGSGDVHRRELSTGAPHDLRFPARIENGGGPRRVEEDRAGKDPVEPIWGPPRRNPEPADLWLADIPAPLDRPADVGRPVPPAGDQPVIASVPVPRTGDVGRVSGRRRDERRAEPAPADEEQAAKPEQSEPPRSEPPREVGTRRRHLEGYRQRPDLRVINGEGTGSGRSRSGRLRAVPPRETTGGRPGPQ